MSKIIVVFCEGSHDVAFLSRLLKTVCYETYHDVKIKNYPSPLNGIFEGSLKNLEFAELKINEVSSKSIPKKILRRDDNVVLFYSLGGNRQYNQAENILKNFIDTHSGNQISGDEIEGFAGIGQSDISFLFFNDADEDFDVEVEKINTFLKTCLKDENFEIRHDTLTAKESFSYGLYLFSEDGKTGNLEDYLIKLMQKENENIFNMAREYYEHYFSDARLVRKKVKCKDKIPKSVNDKKQPKYPNKSVITIAGQLQNSGVSQAVVIEYSDYLTLKKIGDSKKAQEIISFFERFCEK